MSNLSPEQIQLLQKALQQITENKSSTQTNPQQLSIDVVKILEQGPQLFSKLISAPITGAGGAITGLLNGLVGIVTGLLGSTSGLTNGLAPNLVNIIKKEIPIPNKQEK